jgi:hypothetical protein
MHVDSLTIALFYEHPEAGTWSLRDLSEHRGVIGPADLKAGAFFNASGAIRLYCDRFKCFLQTGAAGDLRTYVAFLIESLLPSIGPQSAALFPGIVAGAPFFDYEDVIAGIYQENQTTIVLQDAGSEVRLSYLDPKRAAPEHRLSPYFRDLRIAKSTWQVAAVEGLDEYIRVAEERLRFGADAAMERLVSSWRAVRGSL